MAFIVPATVLLLGVALAFKAYFRFRTLAASGHGPEPVKAVLDEVKIAESERESLRRTLSSHERAREIRAALTFLGLAVLGALGLFLAIDQPVTSESVFVTSLDGSSAKITIPSGGQLRLREALDQASLGEPGAVDVGNPILVAVRIDTDGVTNIWYCPTKLAWQTQAGDWQLPVGCSVRLIAFQDTSLGQFVPTEVGTVFDVKGMISRPGRFETEEMSETVMNASTPAYGYQFDTGPDGPELMVVHRSKSDIAPRERFCIPITGENIDAALLSARIRQKDVIEYTRFSHVRLSAD